jgi:hypothetical protein
MSPFDVGPNFNPKDKALSTIIGTVLKKAAHFPHKSIPDKLDFDKVLLSDSLRMDGQTR